MSKHPTVKTETRTSKDEVVMRSAESPLQPRYEQGEKEDEGKIPRERARCVDS